MQTQSQHTGSDHDLAADTAASLQLELSGFLALCNDILSLAQRQNQALIGNPDYQPTDFDRQRRQILSPLEAALNRLRHCRELWSQVRQRTQAFAGEFKPLLDDIQNLLMRILLLDRENQQAMLRRGLVPAPCLSPAMAQPPHFVAGLYQRHLRS